MPYMKAAQVAPRFPNASKWKHRPSIVKAFNFSKEVEIQTLYVKSPTFKCWQGKLSSLPLTNQLWVSPMADTPEPVLLSPLHFVGPSSKATRFAAHLSTIQDPSRALAFLTGTSGHWLLSQPQRLCSRAGWGPQWTHQEKSLHFFQITAVSACLAPTFCPLWQLLFSIIL